MDSAGSNDRYVGLCVGETCSEKGAVGTVRADVAELYQRHKRQNYGVVSLNFTSPVLS